MKECVRDCIGAFIAMVTLFGLAYLFCLATPVQHSAHNDLEMEVR